MMSELLEDNEARMRIRTAFDSPLFVEAGAGTGKTSELVQRIVGLVEAGRARLPEIVAITFTEAAAGELRERVRAKLEARIGEVHVGEVKGGGVHGGGVHGETVMRLETAVRQVEDAPMQTIHGFANRLLQMYPTAVGLPPVFSVRDATEASLAFDSEWRSVARRLFVSQEDEIPPSHERLLHMAWMLGADVRKLRAMARSFREQSYRLPVAEQQADTFVWLHLVVSLVKNLDDIMALQAFCQADDDTLLTVLRSVIGPWRDRLQTALQANDEFTAIELLRMSVPKGRGSAKKWPADVLQQVRDALVCIEEQRVQVLAVPRQWVLEGLIGLLGDVARDAEQRRIREGTLEFHDLLILADRLVQQEAVRRQIQERYAYVFVDEFQDTDPLQARLVKNLVMPVDGGTERLFTVGDPKQSIYRFRNADLHQYLTMRETFSDAVVQLTTNFRTLPVILSWIDAVFSPLMTESLGGSTWLPLGAGRSGEHAGSVQVFGNVAAPGILSAHVREIETTELAKRLLTARDEGWLVHDRENVGRAIRFGDMAVLLPTRRSLPNLERAFRHAGIPYRVESRSLIWSTQEIRDVVAVLRVLDDGQDENAVIAALRSPAFGCGDDELASWRVAGGMWNLPVELDHLSGSAVGEALLTLGKLRNRARFLDVPAVVNMVIDDRGLFLGAFGHARQRESWSRLRFLADQAQGWFDNGGGGLHAFLQWVQENEELNASIVESVIPESDDDAVRVMTVHAAKGLEFPLAAVVGLGSVPSAPESVRVLWSKDETHPEVRIGSKDDPWQTPEFASAASRDESAENAERLRLLYVAVTRARDHLLVSVHRSSAERSPGSLATALASVCESVDMAANPARFVCNGQQDTIPVVLSYDDARCSLIAAAERRLHILASASREASFSATKIAQKVSAADEVLPVPTAGSLHDLEDLRHRLIFGSAVHRVLEIVEFTADAEELTRVVSLVAIQFGLLGHEARMGEAVAKALSSTPVQEALQSGRYWREVSVAKEVDGVIVRGSIDLLYERDGGLVVVDYKTEAVPTAQSIQDATERYRYQLYAYATALQQEGVGCVEELVLLFIPPGKGQATAVVLPASGADDELRQVLATEMMKSFSAKCEESGI